MTREKRNVGVRAWVTPSLREQLDLFVEEEGRVVSMSDYLFNVIEEHVELKSIRVRKQKISRRMGN